MTAQHAPRPCTLCARTAARLCHHHLHRRMQCRGAYKRIVTEDRTPIALRSPIAHHALGDMAHRRGTDLRNDCSKHHCLLHQACEQFRTVQVLRTYMD